jgi:predicted nucleic acid-binding protein
MAAVARYLADKSALARLRHPSVDHGLSPLIEAGLVATCAMIDYELLWSTRSSAEFTEVRTDRGLAYEWLTTEDADWRRAIDVQEALWAGGRMRSVPLPDLLIASVAERHRVTVLHYDADFDRIGSITGQALVWVVGRGSVP